MTDEKVPAKVTATGNGFSIEFDLQALLETMNRDGRYTYNPETGDDEYEGPTSLHDEIVGATANLLTKSLRSEVSKQIDSAVRERVLAEVTEMVRDGLVNGTLQRTDEWGHAKGEAKPLIDIIRETAVDALTKPVADSFGRNNRETPIQKMITEQVTAAFAKELTEEVNKVRAEVKDAIRNQAAAVIGETIDRARKNLL
jgi:hypothetical protein